MDPLADTESFRDSNAYHEAGHATACHHLGCLTCVTIVADGKHRGRTDADLPESNRRGHLLISLAGPLAEQRYDQKHRELTIELRHYYRLSGADDHREVRGRLEPDESLLPHEECAKAFVHKNWAAIEAIGEKLLQKGTLSAQEVSELVSGTTNGKPT